MADCFTGQAPEECVCYPRDASEPILDGEYYAGCVCGETERMLRAYAEGWHCTAMRPEEREWCLAEIGQVEGYDRSDYAQATDQHLARGVLSAWLDDCRDKGLF